MCEKFIKLNTTEERDHPGDWLAKNHPNAFILIYFIARRARRYNGHPDGLIIGDALIGSADFEPKMSRQNFRTAIEKLVELGYIKIVSNGKKLFVDRKSTIKVTITGMLVNLCDTRIWDINADDGNQRSNQQLTNDQPTANHKLRKNKKEEKKEQEELPQTPSLPVPSKIKFREFVELTQQEYDSLLAKNGPEFLNLMIDVLDAYKGSKGVKYDSDFHTMKQGGWVVNRVKKDLENQQKTPNEKYHKPASGITPAGNAQPSAGKFEANRVLRGSNAIEGDKKLVHE
jgi:hypothetical protein